jgi:hypothetical protein
MIITRALDGDDTGGLLLHALLATDADTSAATLETIVASVRRFPEQPADEIVTSPFYRFYLYTLRAVARKPTIELVKLLVEYKRSGGADPMLADPQVALKEIRILSYRSGISRALTGSTILLVSATTQNRTRRLGGSVVQ